MIKRWDYGSATLNPDLSIIIQRISYYRDLDLVTWLCQRALIITIGSIHSLIPISSLNVIVDNLFNSLHHFPPTPPHTQAHTPPPLYVIVDNLFNSLHHFPPTPHTHRHTHHHHFKIMIFVSTTLRFILSTKTLASLLCSHGVRQIK